jgi:hypothetical protein
MRPHRPHPPTGTLYPLLPLLPLPLNLSPLRQRHQRLVEGIACELHCEVRRGNPDMATQEQTQETAIACLYYVAVDKLNFHKFKKA